MDASKIFIDSFNHMKWADLQIWNEINISKSILNDEKIAELIFHIHLVQNMFLNVWIDSEYSIDRKNKSIDYAKTLANRFYTDLNLFTKEFEKIDFEMETYLPWAGMLKRVIGKEANKTQLNETIMQLIQHSTYHRAQINKRIREIGEQPAATDYIYWAWIGKPEVEFKI